MLVLLMFFVILALVPILTYVTWRAESQGTRVGGVVAVALVFLAAGFAVPILWVGILLGPLLWLLTSPPDTSTRWDKLQRNRRPATPPTPEQVERATARLAKGECPACGARNAADRTRCRVCGTYLERV